MSTLLLPAMHPPGLTQEARTVLKIALVDSTNRQPVFGFEDDLTGLAGESTFTLDGSSEGIELPANSLVRPDSLWRLTLEAGTQVETFYIDLADGLTVTLADLLYGASS